MTERSGDANIEVCGLGHVYGHKPALSDVTFSIPKGCFTALLGPNGAGKSTLLKLLGGIIKPDSGRILGQGYTTALLSRQVGFDPNLTGWDNAVLSALLLGFTRREIDQRMDAIVEFAELEEFIHQPLNTYSLGMRARLGFSVCLELSPDILLIDEALGVGDAAFQAKSNQVIQSRLMSDKTVVLVSHNMHAVKSLCDRAVWIDNGVTVMESSVDEVAEAYGNRSKARAGKAWDYRVGNKEN